MPNSTKNARRSRPTLAFEAEFDRRPQPRSDDDPWDPDRYGDIFSGTD